jgi:photosystem II stability/assembly factor-like uncharacterized protein
MPSPAAPATLALLLAASVALAAPRPSTPPSLDPRLLSGLAARSIGPAAMSGRVAAIAGVPGTATLYVGAATGGVWKSTDGGVTFAPIFDDQPVAAIGAIAVFDPPRGGARGDVVWVGTGEGNVRNSASIGNGVYRSLDGGRTWRHLGLAATERIHRIVLHPTDPDIAWVAALGPEWGDSDERGVFKTSDGGRTWQKVLYIDRYTGAADLAIDPGNPQKLFASTWEFRRWPWFFRSGGPGSGLYVSLDGGDTWQERTPQDGLPKGELGRIGLAVAPSDGRVVYALVEAKESALLRSDDGGRTFEAVNKKVEVAPRPFYFNELRVDPLNPNRLYSLEYQVMASSDGGRSFEPLVAWAQAHGDHHALWIDPLDPRTMVDGNDGGVAISRDHGGSWQFVGTLPLAQFYHVRYDLDRPYNLYGGLQDNGSWRGPSSVWEGGGIRTHHWQMVGDGDGFDTSPDPEDARRGYAMSQGGWLARYDLATGEQRIIRPPSPRDAAGKPVDLRFNWNTGFAQDPFAAGTIYYGSQFVHRSHDRGETWEIVSGDLTRNDPTRQHQAASGGLTTDVTAAENYGTILAIAPSPVAAGVLWVGTDDGRLHVTRDGGGTWTSVEGGFDGSGAGRRALVPPGTWIPHIHPSPVDAASALVVLDNHRRSDFAPYVLRTRDYGATWQSLATAELRGYALSIVQDAVDPDLLFLGTEFGLWWSQDGGRSWLPWRHGVPTVAVSDLAIHPRDNDLILATHGRALFVLDDIRPLRKLQPATLGEPLHLFAPPPVQQVVRATSRGELVPGDGAFQGENRPYGALVTFSLHGDGLPWDDERAERERLAAERATVEAERRQALLADPERGELETAELRGTVEDASAGKPPKATLEVRDALGTLVRTFKTPVVRGVNRVAWDLRRTAHDRPRPPAEGEAEDRDDTEGEVDPGTYQLTVLYGDAKATVPVEVLADPRLATPVDAAAARSAALARLATAQEAVAAAVRRIAGVRADLDAVERRLAAEDDAARRGAGLAARAPGNEELGKRIGEVREALAEVEKGLWQPPGTKGIVKDDDALSRLDQVSWMLGSLPRAPTAAALTYLADAETLAAERVAAADRLIAGAVADLATALAPRGYGLLVADVNRP